MTGSTRKFPRARPYKRSALDVKALVRHRDGYRCQQCGMTAREHFRRYKKTLDVHRLVPGSRYTVKNCITTCRGCHHQKHKLLRHGTAEPLKRIVVHIPRAMLGLLDSEADKNVCTRTAEIIRALKGYYTTKGLWPPPPPDAND